MAIVFNMMLTVHLAICSSFNRPTSMEAKLLISILLVHFISSSLTNGKCYSIYFLGAFIRNIVLAKVILASRLGIERPFSRRFLVNFLVNSSVFTDETEKYKA